MGNTEAGGNRNPDSSASTQPATPQSQRPESRTGPKASSKQVALRQNQSSTSRQIVAQDQASNRQPSNASKAAKEEDQRERVLISKETVAWMQGKQNVGKEQTTKGKGSADHNEERWPPTIEKTIEDFTDARLNINIVEEAKNIHVMTLLGTDQEREAAKKTLQSLANRCRMKETVEDAVLYAGLFSDTATWENLPEKDWGARNWAQTSFGDVFAVDLDNHGSSEDLALDDGGESLFHERSDKAQQDIFTVHDFRQRMIKNQSWYSQFGQPV